MGNLSLIKRNDHDENPDPETRDGPATVEISKVLGRRLQRPSKNEYHRAQNDRPATTKTICSDACDSRTEEGPSGEDGHNGTARETLVVVDERAMGQHGHEHLHFVCRWVVKGCYEGRRGDSAANDAKVIADNQLPNAGLSI
jgi:hypothetical protein